MLYFKQIFEQALNEQKTIKIPNEKWFNSLELNKFSKPFDFGKYLPVYAIIISKKDKFMWYITREDVIDYKKDDEIFIEEYEYKGKMFNSFKDCLKNLKDFIQEKINKINKE